MQEHNNIPSLFFAMMDREPSAPAIFWKEGGQWPSMSWTDVGNDVASCARILADLGVKKGTPVAIIAETRKEWAGVDMAILCLGAITVGIYPTLLADQMAYVVSHSEAEVVIVENAKQAKKIEQFRHELPQVRQI
ncbi:MAG: AMP-binding protein, partial [Proteobacteria bacterium]|nr:AMP-binding protein [Pseudomonadota bacterium]